MQKTAVSPTRNEDYSLWYQQIIQVADLAEHSIVRGCMVIKPWGYAIWENMQAHLDCEFKKTGHVNAYFPLLIPLSQLEREAKHVEGFAKECAVVTHHRLKVDDNGALIPDGKLEEPLIIRPTSETIIGESYAKWVKSYRDLPILINQWANVMRWEMRTRLFLRTSEFLWQEGHTVHATKEEAVSETLLMLNIYAKFAIDILAMPVIIGEKPCFEKFPGAVNTYSIEAMMQDCKALQAGTSHFLGQNFAHASQIQFLDKDEKLKFAWTTSWGVSTRLIGGLIMTHSDDNGLVLPPRIAPVQIVILPILKNFENNTKILDYCEKLKLSLEEKIFYKNNIRVCIDSRDIRGGEKTWHWIKKGVPIRLEIGINELNTNVVTMCRRDMDIKAKQSIHIDDFFVDIIDILTEIQNNLFNKANQFMHSHIYSVNTFDEFKNFFLHDLNQDKGFISCYALDDPIIEDYIKPLKVTARSIPLDQENLEGKCIFTGKIVNKKMIFAKAY